MKNKTSACNLQVINHLTTVKKMIRVHNSETMDLVKATAPVMCCRVRSCGVTAACSPNLLGFLFVFQKALEAKLSWVKCWASVLMCPRLRSPHPSSHACGTYIPKGSNSGGGWHSTGPWSCDRVGLGSLPQGWLESICPLTALPPPFRVSLYHKG